MTKSKIMKYKGWYPGYDMYKNKKIRAILGALSLYKGNAKDVEDIDVVIKWRVNEPKKRLKS